jgi:hypothetical protein
MGQRTQPDVGERLNDAALRYLERKNLSVPATFWRGLEWRLIEPAARNLVTAGATEEQFAGSVRKLEFLLGEVIEGTHSYIRDRDPFLEGGLGEEAAETVVDDLMSELCPLWPFCD